LESELETKADREASDELRISELERDRQEAEKRCAECLQSINYQSAFLSEKDARIKERETTVSDLSANLQQSRAETYSLVCESSILKAFAKRIEALVIGEESSRFTGDGISSDALEKVTRTVFDRV